MSKDFSEAVAFTLSQEGGHSNHPQDPGGETIHGISRRAHPGAWEQGPPTMEQARAIYRRHYWEPLRCDEMPWPIALSLFDSAVNCGKRRAVQMLQQAVNDERSPVLWQLAVDGVLGPLTMQELLFVRQDTLVAYRMLTHRLRLYARLARRPQGRAFVRGWMLRLVALSDQFKEE